MKSEKNNEPKYIKQILKKIKFNLTVETGRHNKGILWFKSRNINVVMLFSVEILFARLKNTFIPVRMAENYVRK